MTIMRNWVCLWRTGLNQWKGKQICGRSHDNNFKDVVLVCERAAQFIRASPALLSGCSSAPQGPGFRDEGLFPNFHALKDNKRLGLAQVRLQSAMLSGKSACEGKEQPVWLCVNKLVPNGNFLMLILRSRICQVFTAVTIGRLHLKDTNTWLSWFSTPDIKPNRSVDCYSFDQQGGQKHKRLMAEIIQKMLLLSSTFAWKIIPFKETFPTYNMQMCS